MRLKILLVLVITVSCNPKESDSMFTEEPLTYLALGDSYTIGESVAENERWPVQLADSLNKIGINLSSTKIIAKTGWTTDELAGAIRDSNITQCYDIVSLLIGVNNQYRGRDAENFRGEFVGLLEQAIEFACNDTSRVLVVSIPDWGVTPFADGRDKDKIALEIDHYNSVKKEETLKRNVLYIDITDISREAENDPTLLAPDGLHPSGKMYSRWISRIIPLLKTRLEN